MFTSEQRAHLRAQLLERASRDSHISSAAITGSAALGSEDRWSDIDLAFAVPDNVAVSEVLADWTNYMYNQHRALHHLDVPSGQWIYRVFLLPDTLQVYLAFVTAGELRALSPSFRIVFGQPNEPRDRPVPNAQEIIGLAWLYALHVRSSLARHKLWQAEYMISAVRDHTLALACLRHALPTVHARGIDQLPPAVKASFEDSLVHKLDRAELAQAFSSIARLLIEEIRAVDHDLASCLTGPLQSLVRDTEGA
jgi:hypothetical protein